MSTLSKSEYNETTIEQLASKLRQRKNQNNNGIGSLEECKAAVLLGAGASKSAGIPLAKEIVNKIKSNYRSVVKDCEETYAAYMGKLEPVDRSILLSKYIKDAKINSAHLYLAKLVKEGYVDRILTTNFDPLIVQGLAYVNTQASVYDLANLKIFKHGQVSSPSVIYLHGQFGGFINLHSKEETKELRSLVKEILIDTLGERCIIVVGYGGENDPVFDVLSEYGNLYKGFYNGLYWVLYGNGEPKEHVQKLVSKENNNYAYIIRYKDADQFFMDLVEELRIPHPMIIQKPFTFLKQTLEKVDIYMGDNDLLEKARENIDEAISCKEENAPCKRGKGELIFNYFDRIMYILKEDTVLKELNEPKLQEAVVTLAKSYLEYNVEIIKYAERKPIKEMKSLVGKMSKHFEKALEIVPESKKRTYYYWGRALMVLARRIRSTKTKISYLEQSIEKFKKATEPDLSIQNRVSAYPFFGGVEDDYLDAPQVFPEEYLDWGNSLYELSCLQLQKKSEAMELLIDACDKFQYVINNRGEMCEANFKWGETLYLLGKLQNAEEVDATFKNAWEKFKEAEKLNSAHYEHWRKNSKALKELERIFM